MKALPLLLMTFALAVTQVLFAQEPTEATSNPPSEEAQNTPAQAPASTTAQPQAPPPNLETGAGNGTLTHGRGAVGALWIRDDADKSLKDLCTEGA